MTAMLQEYKFTFEKTNRTEMSMTGRMEIEMNYSDVFHVFLLSYITRSHPTTYRRGGIGG